MKEPELRFTGSVPEKYERLMVPLLFRPYAEELARRASSIRPKRILETAAGTGAVTIAVVSTAGSELAAAVEHVVAVVVGPEFIAGSTRLKAGTAQKLVLNAISTIAMVRLGKTFGNLMVEVDAANDKLRARVRRIVRTATGASAEDVDEALDAAGGEAKVAIVSLLGRIDAETARSRLRDSSGNVRLALGP